MALSSVAATAVALRGPLTVSWHRYRLKANPESLAGYIADPPDSAMCQALRAFLRESGGRERLLREYLKSGGLKTELSLSRNRSLLVLMDRPEGSRQSPAGARVLQRGGGRASRTSRQ